MSSLSNPSTAGINYISFNQLYNCIIVATSVGFRIYNCNPFSRCYDSYINNPQLGSIQYCCMLYCTSLICLIGSATQPQESPRRLRLFNTKTEKIICELSFISSILAVKLNFQRLVVVLLNKIHIFDLKTMKILHSLDTPTNPGGIIALSGSNAQQHSPSSTPNSVPANNYLVYPGSESSGELIIYDVINLQIISSIRAHNTAIACIALNSQGNLLATASEQGTVIRVFSIPEGNKLFTFRRGNLAANINQIVFNRDSNLIALSSSNSHTIHIFSLNYSNSNNNSSKRSNNSKISNKTEDATQINPEHANSASATAKSGLSSLNFTNLSQNFNLQSLSAVGEAIISGGKSLASTGMSGLSSAAHTIFNSPQFTRNFPALPSNFNDFLDVERDFSTIFLAENITVNSLGWESGGNGRILQIIGTEGVVWQYSVPLEGGACKLLAEYSLKEKPSEVEGVKLHNNNTNNAPNNNSANFSSNNLNNANTMNNYSHHSNNLNNSKLYFNNFSAPVPVIDKTKNPEKGINNSNYFNQFQLTTNNTTSTATHPANSSSSVPSATANSSSIPPISTAAAADAFDSETAVQLSPPADSTPHNLSLANSLTDLQQANSNDEAIDHTNINSKLLNDFLRQTSNVNEQSEEQLSHFINANSDSDIKLEENEVVAAAAAGEENDRNRVNLSLNGEENSNDALLEEFSYDNQYDHNPLAISGELNDATQSQLINPQQRQDYDDNDNMPSQQPAASEFSNDIDSSNSEEGNFINSTPSASNENLVRSNSNEDSAVNAVEQQLQQFNVSGPSETKDFSPADSSSAAADESNSPDVASNADSPDVDNNLTATNSDSDAKSSNSSNQQKRNKRNKNKSKRKH
jgi:autophagy-related protein 18